KDKIIADAKNLDSAIQFTIELYGGQKQAFSKWLGDSFQNNFNRAIFDIMVYYFSVPEILEEAKTKMTPILDSFKNLCIVDEAFLSSFEHTTKSMDNTFKRLTTWGNALADVLDVPIVVPYYNENGYLEQTI